MTLMQTRRRFLATLSLAGAVGLRAPRVLAAEGALETTTVRLVADYSICSPVLLSEELLRAEGFTDVRFVERIVDRAPQPLASAPVDFRLSSPWDIAGRIDSGEPITALGGVHVGCFELFAREGIRNVTDLKGRSVGQSNRIDLLKMMAAQVGLDPLNDIRWVDDRSLKPMELFAEGKVDAFLGFPPEPQELRARRIGHVILDTTLDPPWSQYFCCMLVGNREYVGNYPVATKRVLRAILRAADFCASEPGRAAQRLVDGGFTRRYDYALETLRGIPYGRWRDYDAEDSIRFFALRMHEVGLIKSSPQKIIAKGTDWRSLNELKRELKA